MYWVIQTLAPLPKNSAYLGPICENGIEDECHFVTTCRIYNEARNDLFQVADKLTSNFKEIPTNGKKFIYIMSNEDPNLLAKLGELTKNDRLINRIRHGPTWV